MAELIVSYADAVNASNAAQAMLQKLLPTLTAEKHVGRLVRSLKLHVEEYQALQNGVNKRHVKRDKDGNPVAALSGNGEQVVDITAWNAELSELAKQTVSVTVEDLITEADLPTKRETKPDNEDGRGQFRVGLGPFFDWG